MAYFLDLVNSVYMFRMTVLTKLNVISGVFSPTLFSKVFGDLSCKKCEINVTDVMNVSAGFQCTGCKQSVVCYLL